MMIYTAITKNSSCLYVGLSVDNESTKNVFSYTEFLCDKLGIVYRKRGFEILLGKKARIAFKGNNTKKEREKLRGPNYALIVVDEMQSQPELEYLYTSILQWELYAQDGTIIF
jgi:hypothetical protein